MTKKPKTDFGFWSAKIQYIYIYWTENCRIKNFCGKESHTKKRRHNVTSLLYPIH